MNSNLSRIYVVASLVSLVALMRILPHPYNFTPIGAMALFGGAVFGRKPLSFFIPLAALFVSDFFIGFHSTIFAVYAAFILITILGILFLQKVTSSRIFVLSLVSSLLFFVISNFAVWYGSSFYPQTVTGLMSCYGAGLAFYQNSFFGNLFLNTIMGDLFFNSVQFGSFYILHSTFPKLKLA